MLEVLARSLEVLIGLYYLTMGIDGFLKKLPIPPSSERALKFIVALEETNYILFVVKMVEIGVGLAWLTAFHSGLAWVIFTPIWLNILLYHWCLNKREVGLPSLLFLAHLFLAFKNKDYLLKILLID